MWSCLSPDSEFTNGCKILLNVSVCLQNCLGTEAFMNRGITVQVSVV